MRFVTRATSSSPLKSAKLLVLTAALAAALSGCAAPAKTVAPVFFPPPPDDPRVQYLSGYTSSADLGQKQGGLGKLLVGGTETITKLSKAYGATYKNGKLYVCDVGAGQIVVIDFINRTMKNLNEEVGEGQLKKPVSVAVDDESYVYVADSAKKEIAVYGPDGKYVKALGRDLDHHSYVGVATYKDYVLALDNRRGLIFIMDKKSGELLSKIGENADKTKNLALPNAMAIGPKGTIYAISMGNGTVKEFDLDGNLLSAFGRLGDRPGEFTRPRGIAVDEDSNLFSVDAGHQVVQVFNPEHRILGFFGEPGLPAGSMNLPAGVAVTKDKAALDYFQGFAAPGFKISEVIFVTNQYTSAINSAISVYALGEMAGKKAQPAEKAGEKKPKTEESGKPKAATPEESGKPKATTPEESGKPKAKMP